MFTGSKYPTKYWFYLVKSFTGPLVSGSHARFVERTCAFHFQNFVESNRYCSDPSTVLHSSGPVQRLQWLKSNLVRQILLYIHTQAPQKLIAVANVARYICLLILLHRIVFCISAVMLFHVFWQGFGTCWLQVLQFCCWTPTRYTIYNQIPNRFRGRLRVLFKYSYLKGC